MIAENEAAVSKRRNAGITVVLPVAAILAALAGVMISGERSISGIMPPLAFAACYSFIFGFFADLKKKDILPFKLKTTLIVLCSAALFVTPWLVVSFANTLVLILIVAVMASLVGFESSLVTLVGGCLYLWAFMPQDMDLTTILYITSSFMVCVILGFADNKKKLAYSVFTYAVFYVILAVVLYKLDIYAAFSNLNIIAGAFGILAIICFFFIGTAVKKNVYPAESLSGADAWLVPDESINTEDTKQKDKKSRSYARLLDELATAHDDIAFAREETETVRKQSNEAKKEAQEAKACMEEALKKLEIAIEEKKSSEEKLDEYLNEIEAAKNEADVLRGEADDLRDLADSARNEAETLRNETEILRNEAESAREEASKYKNDIEAVKAEKENAILAINEAVSRIENLTKERDEAISRIESAEEEKKAAQELIDEAVDEIVGARDEAKAAREEAAQLRTEADNAWNEADRFRSEAEKSRLEADNAWNEADRFRGEAEESRLEAENAWKEVEKARNEAAASRLEADAARFETEKIRNESDINRTEALAARKEAEVLRNEAEKAKSEVDIARNVVQELHDRLVKLEHENEKLQGMLDSSSYGLSAICDNQAAYIQKLCAESPRLFRHCSRIARISMDAAELIGCDREEAYAIGMYYKAPKLLGENAINILSDEYHIPKHIIQSIDKINNKESSKVMVKEAGIVMLADDIINTLNYVRAKNDETITLERIVNNAIKVRKDQNFLKSAGFSSEDIQLLKIFFNNLGGEYDVAV